MHRGKGVVVAGLPAQPASVSELFSEPHMQQAPCEELSCIRSQRGPDFSGHS